MIILFEKYISQFHGDPSSDSLADNLGVSMKLFEKIIKGITNWYYDEWHITLLGTGSYGSAFDIKGQNRVLKITSDENEAATVSYLVKKTNVPGIAEYHDIHEVKVFIDNYHQFTLYSIIMEKLYSISSIEREVFMLMFKEYFKSYEEGYINLYELDYIAKDTIECSWNEFKRLNPKDIDSFLNKYRNDFVLKKYNKEEVKELCNMYYDDIMDMIYSTYKYNLQLGDIHQGNIRRAEDGHMKVIDVGGYYSNKNYKNKSASIRIDVSAK